MRPIDHKWNEFGLAVGFEVRILAKYGNNVHPLSLVIDNWHRGNVKKGKPVSWKSVVEALNHIDEDGLAETIEKEHCNQGTYIIICTPHF